MSVSRDISAAKSCAILAGWGALMHISYSRQRRKEEREAKASGTPTVTGDRSAVLLTSKHWLDHPLVTWAVENGCVWILAFANLYALPRASVTEASKSFVMRWMGILAAATVQERMLILQQYVLVNHVYTHIRPFDPPGKQQQEAEAEAPLANRNKSKWGNSVFSLVLEFLSGNLLVQATVLGLISYVKPEATAHAPNWSLARDISQFRPLSFTAKLCVIRTTIDALFYAGHYLIHRTAFGLKSLGLTVNLFKWVHSYHHEHTAPEVLTNQHFSVLDLYVETTVPFFGGMAMLESGLFGAGVGLSKFEESLITGYIYFQEAGTHSGKPVPFVSMLAPLAPLYNFVATRLLGYGSGGGGQQGCRGGWDRRNVEFHQYHHERFACNYSIVQWPDHLMGTTKWHA